MKKTNVPCRLAIDPITYPKKIGFVYRSNGPVTVLISILADTSNDIGENPNPRAKAIRINYLNFLIL